MAGCDIKPLKTIVMKKKWYKDMKVHRIIQPQRDMLRMDRRKEGLTDQWTMT